MSQGSPYDTPLASRVQNGTRGRNVYFRTGQPLLWNPDSPLSFDASIQLRPQAFSASMQSLAEPESAFRTALPSNGEHTAFADMHGLCLMDKDPELYSQPSIGVRSSLVDTDSWYMQQKRRQRSSRIQSVAATGRDSCYVGMPTTPTYSTANSSIHINKSDAVEIESATDFGDPVIDIHAGDALAAETMLMGDNSQAMTMENVAPAISTNNEKRPDARDSSILWMNNAHDNNGRHAARPDARVRVQTVRPGEQGNDSAWFRRKNSRCMKEWSPAFDALPSDRIMFYSSQTGAVHAPNLQNIAYQNMNLEKLVDAVQTGPVGNNGQESCFWLDVSNATMHELDSLGDMFGLHPLTVEDIEQKCSRDKIDAFDDYLFIVYHTPAQRRRNNWQHYYSYCRVNSSIRPTSRDKSSTHNMTPNYTHPASSNSTLDTSNSEDHVGDDQILIVLKRNFVLTFHSGSQHDVIAGVLRRLSAISAVSAQERNLPKPGYGAGSETGRDTDLLAGLVDYPAYIAYAILDQITDQLAPKIATIEAKVDAIDELVLLLSHAEHESVLQQMGEQRRQILHTWQLTQPKPDVLATLARALSGNSPSSVSSTSVTRAALAAEVVQYLGDVQEHVLSAIDACVRAEAVLSRSHSNYLAKISLELSRATFDSNSTTERWTMLGTIVVPINIVTSFLGVNLKVPGQDRDDTLNFFVVLACMLIYTAVTLAFWRWRRIV
ncbi:CorA metal ion transporter [Coemansia sp. RSA 371]|nr:CorA metal ion transporter [Coemansia sp. RSA 371]